VAPFVVGQVGALAALVTSVRRLASADAAREVRAAVLAYFFTAAGYETVDGERLVAPVQLPHLAGGGAAVPSPRTAEFYIRDLGRLVVEAVDDVRFDLKARYAATRGQVGDRADKLARWFRGISALAESAVMGSVEQAVLGVSSFQTNVLIAAAVSTFAGTAARKAAQHVFLHELGA
jgi:hypothetical protein